MIPILPPRRRGKGTGLGLSVVHGIVKGYGGAIYAYSEPDRGTTFNVYLPSVDNPAEVEKPVAPELPRGSEHILAVDDEPALIDVAKQQLEKLGYRVSTADGSLAALEMVGRTPTAIDLVLTDMTMPKMTGEQLAVELMKIRPDLPIIIATGYNIDMSAGKAKEMGIRAFISKPIVEADLARIVRTVLDQCDTAG